MKNAVLFFSALCSFLLAGYEFKEEDPAKYWDFNQLKNAPAYREAGFPDSKVDGLLDILYQGVAPKGQKAEVFAYVGYPATPVPAGGFPGIVLIHGGGGTAYADAVKLWNSYGYAVIAIDWYNQRPLASDPKKRIDLLGGKFKPQPNVEIAANIILAHSLLRTLPKVNPDKTGYVGLSWGSWFGAMVATVDPRFKVAIEIYCGDLRTNRSSHPLVDGRFLHAAKVPMYWVVSTNDQNVTPLSSQRGFDACPTLWNKSMVIALPHSHVGFKFPSCRRVADHFLQGAPPLPKLGKNEIKNGVISAPILEVGKDAKKAILCYTCDGDPKEDLMPKKTYLRKWKALPATIQGKRVSARIPKGTYQCFLSLYDEESSFRDCCGSSDLVIFPREAK